MLEKDIQEVLFSEEQLSSRVNEIARQITQDYHCLLYTSDAADERK